MTPYRPDPKLMLAPQAEPAITRTYTVKVDNTPPVPPLVSFKKQAKERRAAEKAAKREARNKEMFNRWPKGLE